jgi:hypothetical protein
MMADWQEFDGGQMGERYLRTRVTLNAEGCFYFGKKAFEFLGKPDAVKFYFDAGGSRIGVKAVESGENTFTMLHSKPEYGIYGTIRAATFCRHYGVMPEARIEFQDVHIDPDGIMVLDLKTARRVRR